MMEVKPLRKGPRNELHVVSAWNGHIPDTDCWCEPRTHWQTNSHGLLVFIVTHKDENLAQHTQVIAQRKMFPDGTTKLLDSIYMFEHER